MPRSIAVLLASLLLALGVVIGFSLALVVTPAPAPNSGIETSPRPTGPDTALASASPTASPTPRPTPRPTPTARPTPTPTPTPTRTPSPRPVPTRAPTPTLDPTDSPDLHTATDLEAVLPQAVSGIPLHRTSPSIQAQLSADPRFGSVLGLLGFFGKSAADIRFAEAVDPANPANLTMAAFQVRGIDARLFSSAVTGIVVGAMPGATTSRVNLGGKNVTKATSANGGPNGYLYSSGDIVYGIQTADEGLAAAALATLP